MSSRCKKATELPQDFKREDVAFVPQSEKDIEMEKLMASMKEAGIGGNDRYQLDRVHAQLKIILEL